MAQVEHYFTPNLMLFVNYAENTSNDASNFTDGFGSVSQMANDESQEPAGGTSIPDRRSTTDVVPLGRLFLRRQVFD